AFADGQKDDRERDHIRDMAQSLGSSAGGADLMKTYQDVLLGRARLEDAAAALDTPGLRQLAFEMAVGVCDADGVCNEREKAFLEQLRAALGIDQAEAGAITEQADALANSPVQAAPVE
ncbi:DUF533 domain-containing protein, partial [Citrobacter koseri]|uniref:DUF533 domain-containing protein n=1 Tax=Citrobacter koseri TaxID=545 RepID=UPI0022311D19